MAGRIEVPKRIFAFLWAWIVGSVVLFIALIVGGVFMVIDLVWQLITGGEGLSPTGMTASWVRGAYMWHAGQTTYGLTGQGELQLLPSSA